MFLVIGVLVIVIVIITYFVINKRKDTTNEKVVKREISLSDKESVSNFPNIQIIEDSSIIPKEKNKIVDPEIKDAIAILDNAASKGIMAGQNIRNAGQLLKGDKAFFSAAKEGTENMLKVKGSDKVYGIQMKGKDFHKQTQFKNEGQLVERMTKNSLVNAGLNAASLIVGQYYLTEINEKMETMQHDINNISSYLDSEYQGKLEHIISKIKEIVDNKNEILSNDFSREKRYDEILRKEENCTILLGQANSSIKNLIRNDKLDYKKYESSVKEIQKWYTRQQILIRMLLEIGNLRYLLAYGNEKSMIAHTQYNNYALHTEKTNEELRKWHNNYKEKFGINQKEHKRNASFYKVKMKTIAKIKEDWAYNKLDESIEKMIGNQTTVSTLQPYLEKKQDDCIKILKQGENYYNLLGK